MLPQNHLELTVPFSSISFHLNLNVLIIGKILINPEKKLPCRCLIILHKERRPINSKEKNVSKNILKVHNVVRSAIAEAIAGNIWVERWVMAIWYWRINKITNFSQVIQVHDCLDVKNYVENIFIDVDISIKLCSKGSL